MGHLASHVAPLPALAGGAIIGFAASALMLLVGQVARHQRPPAGGMALRSLGRLPSMTKAEGSVRA